MALSINNVVVTPDDLWLAAKQRNWNRLEPETVDKLSILYQKPYKIKKDLGLTDLVPGVILYGGWTTGGHCVLVTGRSNFTLTYHDPLGVFNGEKYNFDKKGEFVNVSSEAATRYIGKPGEIWGHLPILFS
jgi:hypothetical protein